MYFAVKSNPMRVIISTLIFILLIVISCNKEEEIIGNSNSGSLTFSVDTLHFNNVFTTVGSATRYLKVYNTTNKDINLDEISLLRGESSPYRINVDGESGNLVNDVLLRGNDSLYIFADVYIDPNGLIGESLIEEDEILLEYDNEIQNINLSALGIDAHFYSGIADHQSEQQFLDSLDIDDDGVYEYKFYNISATDNWVNDKAHVIYGDVWITNGATLNIGPGSDIYLHNNSNIIVTETSSLNMSGGPNEQIITVQGDRLEEYYLNIPGQWGKIWLSVGSINNKIEYAVIQNGTIGVQIDSVVNDQPSLEIKNTIINNMSGLGLLAQGAHVNGENLLIRNCGQYGVALNIGGKYNFTHCIFDNNYSSQSRQTPNIFLNNYYEDYTGAVQFRALEQANFNNCIIYGDNKNELSLDNNSGTDFNYNFDHCLIKIDTTIHNPNQDPFFTQCLLNKNPEIVELSELIWPYFELDSISPAVNIGSEIVASSVPFDINGNSRLLLPDLGCFERID